MSILKEFVAFLKKNYVEELTRTTIDIVDRMDIPLMKLFAHIPPDVMYQMSLASQHQFLDHLLNDTYLSDAKENLKKWENDELEGGLSKADITPSDLVLLYAAQRRALLQFIPRYTEKSEVAVEIIREIEDFNIQTQDDAFKLLFKMQKEIELEIEHSNQELEKFAYVVSHDLKAPLRAIGTLSEWIMDDHGEKLPEQGREHLQMLIGRVNRMYGLIEGILEYSRIGRIHEGLEKVDTQDLVRKVVDLLDGGQQLKVNIANPLPVITASPTQMSQVFLNLIENAIKHNDKKECEIMIGCKKVEDFYEFSISDNGPGIEEMYFDKIFQIFQTLKPRDEFESTGVGLTIVRKIIHLHGGQIWVRSEMGKGTTFYFSVPVTPKRMESKADQMERSGSNASR
jgi:signal transduction histidine kinase